MIFAILTSILIIGIFCITFTTFLKKNSGNYIGILILEFIGIAINFLNLLLSRKTNLIEYIFIYLLSIIIPTIILYLEKKKIYMGEILKLITIQFNKEDKKNILIDIIEKYPNSYLAHKELANYYEENKEYEKAEYEYIRTIQIKQNDYTSYCKLANIYHENNKEEEAIGVLENLLKIKPDYYLGSMILGNILYENEQFKEAIIVYNDALRFNPSQYDIYYAIGMTYTRLNDFQNAKEYYKKAAKINSFKDISNLNLGQINLIFGDYEKAEKYFYEAINSEDDVIVANSYYYLAKIRLAQKSEQQAINYANLAIEIYPSMKRTIEKDDNFIIILGKIKVTQNEKEKNKTVINEKEKEIIKYLGKTYNVVEKLAVDANKGTTEIERDK